MIKKNDDEFNVDREIAKKLMEKVLASHMDDDFIFNLIKESVGNMKDERHNDLRDSAISFDTVLKKYDNLGLIDYDICMTYLKGMNMLLTECLKRIITKAVIGSEQDYKNSHAKFVYSISMMANIFKNEFEKPFYNFKSDLFTDAKRTELKKEAEKEMVAVFDSCFPNFKL